MSPWGQVPILLANTFFHSAKSSFSGRGWGQQLFSFQSRAVLWMARTSSLNCLSCRNPYQTPHSLNRLPPFHWKPLFFTEKCFVASPSWKSALICVSSNFLPLFWSFTHLFFWKWVWAHCLIWVVCVLKHLENFMYGWTRTKLNNSFLKKQCNNLTYNQKGVVYKLHAGWFVNRTLGEFINCNL